MNHSPANPSSQPLGVKIYGHLIMIMSMIHVLGLLSFAMKWDFYVFTYQFYPEWLLPIRYAFSWFQRIVGMTIGIGLLYYKELFRKLALILFSFAILTLPWKHPYQGFYNAAHYLDIYCADYIQSLERSYGPGLTFVSQIRVALIFYYIVDFVFASSLLYYLTRPKVKDSFH
jgi:hypothetical protein